VSGARASGPTPWPTSATGTLIGAVTGPVTCAKGGTASGLRARPPRPAPGVARGLGAPRTDPSRGGPPRPGRVLGRRPREAPGRCPNGLVTTAFVPGSDPTLPCCHQHDTDRV